jgi:hypothetical protein
VRRGGISLLWVDYTADCQVSNEEYGKKSNVKYGTLKLIGYSGKKTGLSQAALPSRNIKPKSRQEYTKYFLLNLTEFLFHSNKKESAQCNE